MEGKLEDLYELLNHAYDSKRELDGCYNPNHYKDMTVMNEQYKFTLDTIDNFCAVVRAEIKNIE